MKKLTIITINYNNASGLKKTLDSVAAQSTMDFEYVIVDGASTDGSVDIIREFDSLNAQRSTLNAFTWVSEKDSGIYNAMNKGIRMASGEYLLFLNSGDWFYSNDVVQKFMELDCSEEIVAGKEYFTNGYIYIPPKNEALSYDFLMEWPLMHQSTFIKRSAFDKFGLYDETYRIGGDKAWWLRAIVAGNATYRDVCFFVANFDQGGVSSSSEYVKQQQIERTRIRSEILPRVEVMRLELQRLRAVELEFVNLQNGYFGWVVRLVLYLKKCLKSV